MTPTVLTATTPSIQPSDIHILISHLMDRAKSYQNEVASIGTNSYSIVSKRSVEKLYFSRDVQFLKSFVPNFRRRSPLINRGYWLRTRAIESTVESFLTREGGPACKIVVNLGCGYDVLPFRMRFKGSGASLFIDVDYPDLISRKSHIVTTDPLFKDSLGDQWHISERSGCAELESEWYRTIGCDLGDLQNLDRVLGEVLLSSESVLFLAEVSITYMPCQRADALLEWCAKFKNAEFCLLEQYLPAGSSHSFAETMLHHFAKQTPLQSVEQYPLLHHQESRFLNRGWTSAHAQSLWDVWEDVLIVSTDQRRELDTIEPFDEWEEFILFAGHYFILIASNYGAGQTPSRVVSSNAISNEFNQHTDCSAVTVTAYDTPKRSLGRRFGAAIKLSNGSICVLGGINSLPGTEIYHKLNATSLPTINIPESSAAGSCFTVTEAGPGHHLLVGGRKSPQNPCPSCYLYHEDTKSWSQTHDISPARFRHCAVPVMFDSIHYILVYGGRSTNGDVLSDWQLWDQIHTWVPVQCSTPISLFGAAMVSTSPDSGILLGGIDHTLKISGRILNWRITRTPNSTDSLFRVHLKTLHPKSSGSLDLARFGSTLLTSSWGNLLVGGVGRVPHGLGNEIVVLKDTGAEGLLPASAFESLRSFLGVGCCVAPVDGGGLLIMGGGAVCFSFGSSFNPHWLLVERIDEQRASGWRCDILNESNGVPGDTIPPVSPTALCAESVAELNLYDISANMLSLKRPCVLRKIAMGSCNVRWDLNYLENKIGPTTVLSIHKGTTQYLQFSSKNFVYQTLPFSRFRENLKQNDHVYLRSLAAKSPFRKPANFWSDFPGLAADLTLPEELNKVCDLSNNIHSSVLRISGNVAIWLHYDVMSNFLFQARGSKTVVLFQPEEASQLEFASGSTVSTIDIETMEESILKSKTNDLWPSVNGCHPKVVHLQAGDVLFIPRFWPHATFPAAASSGEDTISVAVNVFWRDLPASDYAVGRDVYGSRDLAVYEAGRDALKRLAQRLVKMGSPLARKQAGLLAEGLRSDWKDPEALDLGWAEVRGIRKRMGSLPEDVGRFYLPRLAGELVKLVEDVAVNGPSS